MCQLCINPDASDFENNNTNPPTENVGSTTGLSNILAAMNGSSWSATGQAASITYSFDYINFNHSAGSHSAKILSAADQASVEDMLDIYASVANVQFTEISGKADISIREAVIPGSVGGYANLPTSYGAGVTLDTENGALGNGGSGGFAWYAAIHELGHAMGLHHPFNGNPSTAKPGGIPGSELNAGYTVMSYSDGADAKRGDITGLQLYDIAVLQYKYGANMNHNAGDNVYEFGGKRQAEAVWDGDGNDTFKVADSVTQSANIDLRDGDYLNKIGNAKIKIAFNAEIENAIGGVADDNIRGNELDNYLYGNHGKDEIQGDNGDDVILGGIDVVDEQDGADLLLGGEGDDIVIGNGGNDTLIGGDGYDDTGGGNDILYGGLGNDAMYGGGGNDALIGAHGEDSLYGGDGEDVFVVGWGNGADLIYDFEGAGQSGGDLLRIIKDANDNGITDFDTLMANATDDGTNTYFDMGDGNGILVKDVTKDEFNDSDFDFIS